MVNILIIETVLQNLIFGDNFVGMHPGASAYISEN